MALNPYKIFLILFRENLLQKENMENYEEKWENRFIKNMKALTVLIAIGCGGG